MTTWANPIDPGLVSMQRALGDYFTLLTPDSLEHCIDASILGCHRVTLLTPDEVPSPRCQDSCRLIGFIKTINRGRKEPCNAALFT